MSYRVIYRDKGKTQQKKLIAFSFSDAVRQMDILGVPDSSILAIILIDD